MPHEKSSHHLLVAPQYQAGFKSGSVNVTLVEYILNRRHSVLAEDMGEQLMNLASLNHFSRSKPDKKGRDNST